MIGDRERAQQLRFFLAQCVELLCKPLAIVLWKVLLVLDLALALGARGLAVFAIMARVDRVVVVARGSAGWVRGFGAVLRACARSVLARARLAFFALAGGRLELHHIAGRGRGLGGLVCGVYAWLRIEQ
jgi:hypothetical protein